MKFWITKYALTSGVRIIEGTPDADSSGREYVRDRIISFYCVYCLGRDAFRSEADALMRVKDMIKARRRSLDKSRSALDKLAKEVEAGRLPMAKGKA